MQEPNPSSLFDAHPYLRQTLDLVADKWVVAVLYILSHGTKRYGELQREIGDISQWMLTRTLRDLECNGLVDRKVYPVVPPVVEYSLTPLGQTLNQVLKSLCNWSTANFQYVEVARSRYTTPNLDRLPKVQSQLTICPEPDQCTPTAERLLVGVQGYLRRVTGSVMYPSPR